MAVKFEHLLWDHKPSLWRNWEKVRCSGDLEWCSDRQSLKPKKTYIPSMKCS